MGQAVIMKPRERSAAVKEIPVLDVDRSEEFRWLETHADSYSGRWVAVSKNELVADAQTLKDLLREIGSKTLDRRPLIHHLP